MKQKIELLAPARDSATAMAALEHGADAVYMGGPSLGARAAATNSIDDIARIADRAHRFGAKLYVTMNTIIYDRELDDALRQTWQLYRAGADALIVQDMALTAMEGMPPIDLHASTQCDIRDIATARRLAASGFSRIVVAREMDAATIAKIKAELPSTEIEAFVHGALCVCYSGDCRASLVSTGRSANRGECSQICRLPFDLVDGSGRKLVGRRHLLSLRDMNRSAEIGLMARAGVMSFKIEGRLKDVGYVKTTVGAYRRIIDDFITANPDEFERTSLGESALTFTPDLTRAFNRGFTTYYIKGPLSPGERIASTATPKSVGREVARSKAASKGRQVRVRAVEPLVNGDGLSWFNSNGELEGFRVNRVDGDTLMAARPINIPADTPLFRSFDKRQTDMLEGDTARRTIAARMTLRRAASGIALDIAIDGITASAALPIEPQPAKTPQLQRRRETLTKTGDTVYRITEVDDRLGDEFVAASQLTALRRKTIDALDRSMAAHAFRRLVRKKSDEPISGPLPESISVANRAAADFYKRRGATGRLPMALETEPERQNEKGLRVMTTRYCLRHELGACLKTPSGKQLPQKLFLKMSDRDTAFELRFDCRRCRMELFTT